MRIAKGIDCLIYGYLIVLGVFCVVYAFVVVYRGGIYAPGITINVVLPQTTIQNGAINNTAILAAQLAQINKTEVYGVVVDVWWGLVETEPLNYTWDLYDELFGIIQQSGLKVKASLAFHASEDGSISLPDWVHDVGLTNPNIYYTDRQNNSYTGCISCGVDYQSVFPPNNARTGVEVYIDFIQSFAAHYSPLFDTLIYQVQVGLGPNGELRYPSFANPTWQLPGIGEFQCYDKYLLQEYSNSAYKSGQPGWAFPPNNSGTYNLLPINAPFFQRNVANNYESDYGQFFLKWYSQRLIQHGQSVLANAISILSIYSPNVTVAAKLGCIYWQYKDPSHAAELTAGYKNDLETGYNDYMRMYRNLNISFDFGCFDLSDGQSYPQGSNAGPQELVFQTLEAAQSYGLRYEGANTGDSLDDAIYGQIEKDCRKDITPIVGFDFYTLQEALFELSSFDSFRKFTKTMAVPGPINKK